MGCFMECKECKTLFSYEKENEINVSVNSNRKSKIKDLTASRSSVVEQVHPINSPISHHCPQHKQQEPQKYQHLLKFNYLKLDGKFNKLEEELQKLLKDSIKTKKNDLNINKVFEKKDVQKENKEIIIKIKKQLINYKSSIENYLMKRAIFLKKVGYLVRFSHEIAIYIFQYLFKIFKEENGIQSIEEETKLLFSSWIKELFNEDCFKAISKNKNIYVQVKNEIEKEINSKNEIEFLLNIFPDFIRLYFHCFLIDAKVDIKYAKEDSKFVSDYMIDILLTGLENGKNILFTFLPGLYCDDDYLGNSYIYVTAYPINNPNRFPFEKPVFKAIESDINIELDNINLKDKKKNGILQNGNRRTL